MFSTWRPEDLPPTRTFVNAQGKISLIRTMLDGDYRISAGTLDGLIEALADLQTPGRRGVGQCMQSRRTLTRPPHAKTLARPATATDSFFIDDFLMAYRAFVTKDLLLAKLFGRYPPRPR